jgi:hypothetical protein
VGDVLARSEERLSRAREALKRSQAIIARDQASIRREVLTSEGLEDSPEER